MPEFKKEGRGFKMKGFTPFTQKTKKTDERVFGVNQEKYDKWNRLKNRGKGPDVRYLGAKENMSHLDKYLKWKTEGAKFIAEDGSPMKKKTDPPKKKERKDPTWMGTDEYRKPEDIPAQEYIDRGLNPADYIPGYKAKKKEVKIKRKDKKN